MRSKFSAALLGALCLGGAIYSQIVEPTRRTEITVNETVLVPGKELPPGKYVLKVMNATANRHIVQIYNEDQTQLQTTILAIPNERVQRTENTVLTYWETPAGVPPALRAWFYPGDTYGQEFAYPKEMAERIVQANKDAQVPSYEGTPNADQLSTVTITTSRTTTTPASESAPSNGATRSAGANTRESDRTSQSATSPETTATNPSRRNEANSREPAIAESPQNTATTQADTAIATAATSADRAAERAAETIESTTPRVPPPTNAPKPAGAEQAGRSDIRATDINQNDETPAPATTASRSTTAGSTSSADRSAGVGAADRSADRSDTTVLAQNTPRPGAPPNTDAQSNAGRELPRTASHAPLVLLTALLSIAGAAMLRALRA